VHIIQVNKPYDRVCVVEVGPSLVEASKREGSINLAKLMYWRRRNMMADDFPWGSGTVSGRRFPSRLSENVLVERDMESVFITVSYSVKRQREPTKTLGSAGGEEAWDIAFLFCPYSFTHNHHSV